MLKIPKKVDFLKPCLPLISIKSDKEESPCYIGFLLRINANEEKSPKYKKSVRKFGHGTPDEWIALLKDLRQVWRQNAVEGAPEKAAVAQTVLIDDALIQFDTTLEELEEGEEEGTPITETRLQDAIDSVSATVFPHRALQGQRNWMMKRMKKPRELTMRNMVSAVNRLNNSLSYFPDADETSKFDQTQILDMLESSSPAGWKSHFDLKGYIPAQESLARFITECEQLERHEPSTTDEGNSNERGKKKKDAKMRTDARKSDPKKSGHGTPDKKYFCTEHGQNPTHGTESCFTLKNRAKRATGSNSNSKRFSTKEINQISKTKSRRRAIEMFATLFDNKAANPCKPSKKAKVAKKKQAKNWTNENSDSSSGSEESNHNIESDASVEFITTTPPARKRRKKITFANAEEENYQKKIGTLSDRLKHLGERFTTKYESGQTHTTNTSAELEDEQTDAGS